MCDPVIEFCDINLVLFAWTILSKTILKVNTKKYKNKSNTIYDTTETPVPPYSYILKGDDVADKPKFMVLMVSVYLLFFLFSVSLFLRKKNIVSNFFYFKSSKI